MTTTAHDLLASYLGSARGLRTEPGIAERLRSVLTSDAVASIICTVDDVHDLRLAMQRIDARATQREVST
jgi:hypothetical protein